jgi:predicted RNA-binding Zn ribbon-like protein
MYYGYIGYIGYIGYMEISASKPKEVQPPVELEIGGHLALAFINTVWLERGETVDLFQNDDDVRCWLQRVGLPVSGAKSLPSGVLLSVARSLRELLRQSTVQRKAGQPVILSKLNAFFIRTSSHLEMTREEGSQYRLNRVWPAGGPEQFLAPLADAAAELFVEGDFTLIRQCESDECVLWFLDTTRAHRRRWCSMATCGNRAKVSSFRARHISDQPKRL